MSEFERFTQHPQVDLQSYEDPYHHAAQGGSAADADRRTWLTKRLESPAARFFWRRHKNTIIAMVIAFLLAMMIVGIGFGYTLLTVIFLAIGFFVGGWRDGNPLVYNILRRFL